VSRLRGKKRAGATVEMAVVTPLLVTMLLGIIEYGWVFAVRQALVSAAREGARTAALPASTEEDVRASIDQVLRPLGLTTYNVQMTHATPANPTETIRIAIPYSDVTLVGGFFGPTNYDLGATCSMRKEGLD